jgi:N-acyl-D-aspartate/D-glutamate deacylase
VEKVGKAIARIAAVGACAFALTSIATAQTPRQVDLLIRGGVVIDGTGDPRRNADVAVDDGRIVLVGDASRWRARRTINANGLVVAPGFIDPHTHSLSDLTADEERQRRALNHLTQGVTTILVGNDGDGAFEIAAQRNQLERLGVGVNVGAFVGFGAVREAVLGQAARAPTPEELDRMRGLVAQGMCEGAVGFSAGLYYAPQSFSQTEEVITLAREAALRGGLYETHLRDESSDNIGLIAAVEEALRIGRDAGLPVHFAHIKAQGVDVHGQSGRVIELIEAAQAAGQRVTADQYPWRASGTRVSNALIPRWTQEDGGPAAMRQRLADPALAERLDREIGDNIRRRGGPESLLLTSGEYRGRHLGQVAQAMGVDPIEAARRIALGGDARLASFNMREDDIRNFMARPWVVTSSDATQGHPRRFGTFPLKFALYVRDEPLLTVEQFVHRSSGLTAQIFGLEGRGLLREGYAADIVVLDPRRYAARATFEEPELYSEGVLYAIVNGELAIDRATPTGELAGQALAHSPTGGCE